MEARRTYKTVLSTNIKFALSSPSRLPNWVWNPRIHEQPTWKTVQFSKIPAYLKAWKKCWMSKSSPSKHSAPISEFKKEVLDEPSYKIRVYNVRDHSLKVRVLPTAMPLTESLEV